MKHNPAIYAHIQAGEAIDITSIGFEVRGGGEERYRLDDGAFEKIPSGTDLADAQKGQWVYSVGRCTESHDVYVKGVVYASLGTDLYMNPKFECLWLR